MANQLLTISMITKESLRVLVGNLKFATNVNRGFNDEFQIKGAKIGQTVNIRKPARYSGRTGPVVNIEAQTETYVPLTLNQQYGVDLAFTSAEQSMSLDLYSDRVIKPAMAQIASRIDAYVAAQAKYVPNLVGSPGTALSSLTNAQRIDLALAAGVKLDNNLAPRDGMRSMLVSPQAQADFNAAGLNLFNPAGTISEQYKSGQLTEALGFGWYMDQQLPRQDAATYAGSPVVNTSTASGSTITITGFTSGSTTLVAGTVFTIQGVNAVNPQTKQDLGVAQQFVVMSDVSDVSGTVTATVSPAFTTSGAFQTVAVTSAGSGKTVTIASATGVGYNTSVAFHRDAFVCGWAELDVPGGVDMSVRATDPDTGVSVRMIRSYDVRTDQWITRFDTLFGANTLYEQLAVRIATS